MCNSFCDRIIEIEKINDLLEILEQKGYSENISIIIKIYENNSAFKIDDKNIKDYQSCKEFLDELINKINETQIKYYMNEELLRYLYGKQFNLLNFSMKKQINKDLIPILKFITNDEIDSNRIIKDINYKYDYKLNNDKYDCFFENIKKFLTNFLKNNNLEIERIYKQNIIKNIYRKQFEGLFTYLLEDIYFGEKNIYMGIEENILIWYNFLTGHPPMAQTLLLCNKETSIEEISAFMYRAFLCQYSVFFVIGKIEILSSEKKQTLKKLIDLLFNKRKNDMKSCVTFAFSELNDDLFKYLNELKGHKILKHEDKKKEENKLFDENIEIISSDKAGTGKSTQIKLKVEKEKKKYIYFPIGGLFGQKEIINRLKNIQEQIIDEDNIVIHLDLYISKNIELMKIFLYKFLITKFFGQNENLFYLPKKIKIIIEIPCEYFDFFKKYPLINMFEKRKEMKIENLPPMIVSKELGSNIQIVCNYLKLLKSGKISDKDLIIDKISLSSYDIKMMTNEVTKIEDTILEATPLEPKECENLIKDLFKNEFKIEYPSYYQINSFVTILSGQLKKFSMNFTLTAAYLIQNGIIIKDETLKNLREFLINSFIKISFHLTQNSFNNITNSHIETYEVYMDQSGFNDDRVKKVAINALSYLKDTIPYNIINPSLIFCSSGEGQDFIIISMDKPNKEGYDKLLQLKKDIVAIENEGFKIYRMNDKIQPLPEKLKNYKKFNHCQFLEEIKEILSLKNVVYTKDKEIIKKNKYEQNHGLMGLKSIEEIVGDYIFTVDNFIKTILILLRERENLPIIMMGETGCGKTSLIRKISELINNGDNKLEILNVHAGITNEDIYKFLFDKKIFDGKEIESVVEKAKKLEEKEKKIKEDYKNKGMKYIEKKLWVFFDEINSCNCLGLINEIFTKNSCQGTPLPNNIFFIGACHPYRYDLRKQDNPIKYIHEKYRLVYKVNPLPFSLINYVVNFGSIKPEEEEDYIKNMIIRTIDNFFWKEIEEKHKNDEDFKKNNEYMLSNFLNKEDNDSLKQIAIQSIIEAQNYIRDKNDISSVSLRDIRRFCIFYNFFVEFFKETKKII